MLRKSRHGYYPMKKRCGAFYRGQMKSVLITGSCGLIGSEASRFYLDKGFRVIGVDNDMRSTFFGPMASTSSTQVKLSAHADYRHYACDIRDHQAMEQIFQLHGSGIRMILHTAAQPSHDWAARDPITDFSVNAAATLQLLELTRKYCKEAVFLFTSTNKVYGDSPNTLPLVEQGQRLEISKDHPYFQYGIDENMSIDQSTHSLFGVSKVSADLMVQEYGRYFGMATACFRGGCLTGPGHAGTELHGFLAYLVKATMLKIPYRVYGYNGRQVRDNIHSEDLITAFDAVFNHPVSGEVYNIGGSRRVNCSMLEAIELVQEICGRSLDWTYEPQARIGDHRWWISDTRKFEMHFPVWKPRHDLRAIITQIRDAIQETCSP